MVLHIFYFSVGQPVYVQHFAMVYATLGTIAITYLFGIIVTLLLESPIMQLERIQNEHKEIEKKVARYRARRAKTRPHDVTTVLDSITDHKRTLISLIEK